MMHESKQAFILKTIESEFLLIIRSTKCNVHAHFKLKVFLYIVDH